MDNCLQRTNLTLDRTIFKLLMLQQQTCSKGHVVQDLKLLVTPLQALHRTALPSTVRRRSRSLPRKSPPVLKDNLFESPGQDKRLNNEKPASGKAPAPVSSSNARILHNTKQKAIVWVCFFF